MAQQSHLATLRRVEEHPSQPETIKTCFGILAIMSRDDAHKTMIAVDGMERILSAMMTNIDRPDVQEAGCDLLWSLAFNSAKVKEVIGKYGGTTVLVRALKRHNKSADFLKSACGALSNLCQSKMNQHGFSSHGGIMPLVGAISLHQQNARLLPFIFDALASLIVGNEENARLMSAQDGVTLILSTLAKLKTNTDVVKSGCHTLAILSDVKGQANKIALGGGVVIILSLLDLHPSYADFHRVAAVVLLRMLQETPAIAREITSNDGVRILLKSLDKGGALEDTVAAVTHILSAITSPMNANAALIESQLWIGCEASSNESQAVTSKDSKFASKRGVIPSGKPDQALDWQLTSKSIQSLSATQAAAPQVSALRGLVRALETYAERRDVVRAGCRLLSHVLSFAGVVLALDSLNIMDRVFHCVSIHAETKDVLESTASLLKAIHRRTTLTFTGSKPSVLKGVMVVLRYKIADDDVVTACMELLGRYHGTVYNNIIVNGGSTGILDQKSRYASGGAGKYADKGGSALERSPLLEPWEHECLGMCFKVVETLLGSDHNAIDLTTGLIKCISQQRKSVSSSSTKSTKMLNAVLNLIEKIATANKGVMNTGPWENQPQLSVALARALHTVSDTLTPKYSDIIRKIEALLPSLTNRCERPGSAHRSLGAGVNSVSGLPVRPSSRDPALGSAGLRPSSTNAVTLLGAGLVGTEASSADTRSGSVGAVDSARRGFYAPPSAAGSSPPVAARSLGAPISAAGDLVQSQALVESGATNALSPLLINWPIYLEKIITSPMPAARRTLDELLDSAVPRMHLVYDCRSAAGLGVASRCPVTLPYGVPAGGVGPAFEHSLTFNSEFECGNIQCAIQRGERLYDLCLRPDVHTPGHTQWFYFAVSNIHSSNVTGRANLGLPVNKIVKIQFNIINFTKPDSSFNSGMRPVFYSMQDAAKKGVGWVRQGADISYTANEHQRLNAAGEGVECYFTLSFSLEFKNIDDTCLVAYSYPYSYTDCRMHIESLVRAPRASDILRRQRLCKTLSGKDCELLIITDFTEREGIGPLGSSCTPVANVLPAFDTLQEQTKPSPATGKTAKRNRTAFRRGIFISARVHPGETPASWVMRGSLDFLVGESPAARMLRRNYVFFVVPMLNPDGVIFGNNRCALAGVDLNRQWKMPMKQQHPTIFHLKTLMLEQKSFRDIVMYIDIHGHSRKYNVFLYGCDDKKKPTPKARDFPRIFAQHDIGKKFVSLDDCSFHVKKSREATARVVACRDLNIPMSYTIEATFCGPDMGPLKHYHMNIGHLLDCGGAMIDSILQYAFADGQFPEGAQLPDPFRGLTRIDANSYLSPEESHKLRGAGSMSVETARALLDSGDSLLRAQAQAQAQAGGQGAAHTRGEHAPNSAAEVSAGGSGSGICKGTATGSAQGAGHSKVSSGDASPCSGDLDCGEGEGEGPSAAAASSGDGDAADAAAGFLSGSSDEDEERDDDESLVGDAGNDNSNSNGNRNRNSNSNSSDARAAVVSDRWDSDYEDSVIEAEAEEGAEAGGGGRDSESLGSGVSGGGRVDCPAGAGAGAGAGGVPLGRARPHLRALLEDRDHNAGMLGIGTGTGMGAGGIAMNSMLPRIENSHTTLDDM
jgi:hypothetical protein